MDGHTYIQQNPRKSAHFQLVDDYFETLEHIWKERYLGRYGFWRTHYSRAIWEYLDCVESEKLNDFVSYYRP